MVNYASAFSQSELGKYFEGIRIVNNSFSVEQVSITYFTVTGVSKQVLLFALIIFYLRSANFFFRGLCRDSFL